MELSGEARDAGCLFLSDHGIEQAAHEYRELVEGAGMRRNMSDKGKPLDNAAVESFFHTLEAQWVHQRMFANEIEAVAHIVEYIEFYNRERLHSAIGHQFPARYEKLCAQKVSSKAVLAQEAPMARALTRTVGNCYEECRDENYAAPQSIHSDRTRTSCARDDERRQEEQHNDHLLDHGGRVYAAIRNYDRAVELLLCRA